MVSNTQEPKSAALRQPKNMSETASIAMSADLELLNLKEVAAILRVAEITIIRMVAKRALPVYRICRKLLFKKQDVLDCLERAKNNLDGYDRS